jgi:hypothetical protein
MSAAPFDPLRLLKTLNRHEVRFVIIGGIAGRLWGSTTVTNDLDICYARDGANLTSLANALRDLKVKLRGVDPRDLESVDQFNAATMAGNLNCVAAPRGSAGYDSLARNAEAMDVGAAVKVTALQDLILMKRAGNTPKDLIEVEILSAVRDEIEREKPATVTASDSVRASVPRLQ